MFPIPWNFPLRKKNGNLVNIGDAIDEGSELPEHGEADAGKVLSVDENGDLEWSDEVSSEIEALQNNVDGNWSNGGRNIFNPAEAFEGRYIIDSNGTEGFASGCTATDYVPVKGGENYVITTEQSSGEWAAWYDSNKNYISGFSGYSSVRQAPSNATYLRATIQRNDDNPNWATTTQIEQGDSATPYVPYAMTNRELTEKVSAQNYSISLEAGYNTDNGDIRVIDGVCYFNPRLYADSDLTVGTPITVGTLPNGCKPKVEVRIPSYTFTNGLLLGVFQIYTNGDLKYFPLTTNRYFGYTSAAFPIA